MAKIKKDVLDVAQEVQALMASWNPPPENAHLSMLVGQPVPQGDSRATAHVPGDLEKDPLNPGNDGVDAALGAAFTDDLDKIISTEMSKDALKAEAEARDLSQAGSKQDLVDRIIEHDASQDEGDPDE